MWATIITALVALVGSAGAILLTKWQEREATWRAKKLAYYEEFFGAASGIVGNAPVPAKIRFATAVNNLHLIGSADVIRALHAFTDEIAESNSPGMTKERHDQLWSRLVWEIRADLGDPPGEQSTFTARLWASGAGTNSLSPP
jgi:glutathione S-transferase